MKTATQKKWTESVINRPESIDREACVINGVKVVGYSSSNRRDYEPSTLREAIPLYENAKVYVDHPKRGENERSVRDRWGTLKNVREGKDGLYGDLHYLKSHSLTEQILEAAERFPETFGLSHNASGQEKKMSGRNRVTCIESVFSVDVVTEPATNKGLFESKTMSKTVKAICESNASKVEFAKILLEMCSNQGTLKEMEMGDGYDPSSMAVDVADDADPADEVASAFRAICVSILDDDTLDSPSKLSKLRTILKAKAEVQEAVGADEAVTEADATTPESDPAQMEESAKALKEANENNVHLQEQIATFECEKCLRESKREVSDIRVAALKAIKSEDRKKLIESWPSIDAAPEKKRPLASPSKFTESTESTEYPKSREEIKRFINSR